MWYLIVSIPDLCTITYLFYLCFVFYDFASVDCYLVVACCERADLLALVFDVLLCICLFPMWYPGSDEVLDCINS